MISAGAKIIGSFKVGDDSKIGAGSVVLHEVPPNSTVVGIPGKVVRRENQKVHPQDLLDQVHLPDPVRAEMCRLIIRIEALEQGKSKLSPEEVERIRIEKCKNCPEDLLYHNLNGIRKIVAEHEDKKNG